MPPAAITLLISFSCFLSPFSLFHFHFRFCHFAAIIIADFFISPIDFADITLIHY
jgi:hypothetical protein